MDVAPPGRVGSADTTPTRSAILCPVHVEERTDRWGGGFVDGIVFHPKVRGLRYARTDIGGAYRWNDQAKRWEPLLDWVSYPDRNLMGVESIAVDPSDPDRVYLACGTGTVDNGGIFKSSEGQTDNRGIA